MATFESQILTTTDTVTVPTDIANDYIVEVVPILETVATVKFNNAAADAIKIQDGIKFITNCKTRTIDSVIVTIISGTSGVMVNILDNTTKNLDITSI
jgi:hypothetical protein